MAVINNNGHPLVIRCHEYMHVNTIKLENRYGPLSEREHNYVPQNILTC